MTDTQSRETSGRTPAKVLVVDDSPTVLRVMEFVLSQAGYEVACLEGGREVTNIARQMKPDLVFIDFSMPEMNGFEVCRALGEDPVLETIPIIIMSTRGDPVGDRFVRDLGVVDHITKPFAPEALLALVQHTLRKTEEIDLADRRRPDDATTETPAAVHPASELAAKLAESLGPLADEAKRHLIAARLEALLTGDELETELTRFGRSRGKAAFSGDLAQVSIAEVMQLLSLQRQSGILTVEHGTRAVSIAFKGGKVRLVTGENMAHELLLGNILVREKLIESRELEVFLNNRKGTTRRLGSQVVKLGYLSREDLQRALQRQSSELVYELLRWGRGQFAFERKAELPEEVLEFDFGMTIDELLMEGFRRVDEWGLIESVLPSFDLVPTRVTGGLEHLGPQGLTAEERSVYDAVDGARRVSDIIEVVGEGAFAVARVLYRLLSVRAIAVVKGAGDPG